MVTTKDDMVDYLHRLQKLQQMAMGLADLTVRIGDVNQSTYIDAYVVPRDSHQRLLKDKKGELVLLNCTVRGWIDKEENDRQLKEFTNYLKAIGVL